MMDSLAIHETATLLNLATEIGESDVHLAQADVAKVSLAGYRLSVMLGRSAYTEVFRGVCEATDRDVVVKFAYASERVSSVEHAELLISAEAAALSKLAGPGVAPLFASTTAGFGSYVITRYVGDCDLLTYCRDCGGGAYARVALFLSLLKTVASIHARGWVHGDLKPNHILIDQGHPVLIDFGLAASIQGTLTQPRRLGGTRGYAAPELIDRTARQPDPRQDIFSLGKILGDLVKDSDTNDLRLRRVKRVIKRATHLDVGQRYPDADLMASDLQAALEPRRGKTAYVAATCLMLTMAAVPWLIDRPEDEQLLGRTEQRGGVSSPPYQHLAGLITSDPNAVRAALAELPRENRGSWEASHLAADLEGRGTVLPFGPDPMGSTEAVRSACDPTKGLLVWAEVDGRVYRQDGTGRSLLEAFPPESYAYSLDLHPNRDEVLLCTATGSVFMLSKAGTEVLDAAVDSHGAWYSADGRAVYVYSRGLAELTLIDLGTRMVRWRVPTGGGVVLHAASDPDSVAIFRRDGGAWSMTPVTGGGELGDRRALPQIDQNVLAYDADAATGQIVIGSYNGQVNYYNDDAWQELDCTESLHVVAVCLAPGEGRIFAATSVSMEVLDPKSGIVTLKLGGRTTHHRGIQRLAWSETDRSITAVSGMGVTSWSAGPSP